MSYQTPELLLVGAAQSLVLGTLPKWVNPLNYDGASGSDAYDNENLNPDDSTW